MAGGGAAGEGLDGAAGVEGAGDGVSVGIAVGAERESVGGAADGGGIGGAVVAELGAHVLAGEGVGTVHVPVAE